MKHFFAKSVYKLTSVCILLLASGCESSSTSNDQSRPELPKPETLTSLQDPKSPEAKLPIPRDSQDAIQYFSDVLNHPWIKEQPRVKNLNQVMVDDIRSIQALNSYLNHHRHESGIEPIPFELESEKIIQTIHRLQSPLTQLPFTFPEEYYSILNIPDASPGIKSTLMPYDIYKRIYLGDNALGLPFYLDVRVFSIGPEDERQYHVDSILHWHLGLLEGGVKAFQRIPKKQGVLLIGKGIRNLEHFDNSHGFAVDERGVLLAFFAQENILYVLYADAPWVTFSQHKDLFFNLLN